MNPAPVFRSFCLVFRCARPGLIALALVLVGGGAWGAEPNLSCAVSHAPEAVVSEPSRLIVIGFMGGHVKATNLVHREALVAQALTRRYPAALHAAMFANRDHEQALATILKQLDPSGCPTAAEKRAARIVIFGHSWGASETVALARRLNELAIPVLLTIQVDSVSKPNEDDGTIPPNVREAINFYQTEGLLHGRPEIQAADPKATTILGNFQSFYRAAPVDLAGYPWFARTFMKSHIEIENDARVWDRIEALISSKVGAAAG